MYGYSDNKKEMPQITNARLSCSNLKSRSVHQKKSKNTGFCFETLSIFCSSGSDWCCMQLMIFLVNWNKGFPLQKWWLATSEFFSCMHMNHYVQTLFNSLNLNHIFLLLKSQCRARVCACVALNESFVWKFRLQIGLFNCVITPTTPYAPIFLSASSFLLSEKAATYSLNRDCSTTNPKTIHQRCPGISLTNNLASICQSECR